MSIQNKVQAPHRWVWGNMGKTVYCQTGEFQLIMLRGNSSWVSPVSACLMSKLTDNFFQYYLFKDICKVYSLLKWKLCPFPEAEERKSCMLPRIKIMSPFQAKVDQVC